MIAIISLVPDEHSAVLRSLANLLVDNQESKDGELRYPHFSWQVAENYDLNALSAKLKILAQKLHSFEITINGIGIFTGIMPVVYLPIIKSSVLASIHNEIWKITEGLHKKPIDYYEMEQWIPHITILHQITPSQFTSNGLNKIITLPIKLKMKIDNIAVGEVNDENAKILGVYHFG